MNYKLGKLAPRLDDRTFQLKKLMLAPELLPPRPKMFKVTMNRPVVPKPQMWANDEEGNCVECAMCNHQTFFELTEQQKLIKISTSAVDRLYHRIAGPGDSGTVYLDAMNYWHQVGIRVGQKTYKIDAFAAADWTKLEEVKYAIWLLNGLQVGVQLPTSAGDQFEVGKPWTVVPGARIEGGHGLFFGGYDDAAGLFTCWTWAREQLADYDWLVKYGDESYAAVDAKNKKNSVLNVPLLEQYLREITR